MASVAQDAALSLRIDHSLDYLEAEWSGITSLATEWDSWDDHSRVVFALDWPIREDRLSQVQEWAKCDLLSSVQCQRLALLLLIVEARRPLLEQLLADDSTE